MKTGRENFKKNWLWVLGIILAGFAAGVLWAQLARYHETTYGFNDADKSQYEFSDPEKAEIKDGTLHLSGKEGERSTTDPYIKTKKPVVYGKLTGFSEQVSSSGQGAIGYQLSQNGRDWQYWDGDNWAAAEEGNYQQSNDAPTVNQHIDEYSQQTGEGEVYTDAILHAPSATAQVSLTSFSVSFQPLAAGMSVDSVSPATGTTDGGNTITLNGSGFYNYGVYRTLVNITNTVSDLTDYPVLVTFDSTGYVSSGKMRADGADLRVVDINTHAPLPFWIEPGTMNTPNTKVWVRMPTLVNGGTSIALSYGNPQLASASDANATFAKQLTGAQAAWPMEENMVSTYVDYSGNGNSYGTSSTSYGKVFNGKYGLGRGFDGTTSAAAVPNSTTMRPTAALTVESWVYPIATSGTMYIINAMNGTNSYGLQIDGTNKIQFQLYLNNVLQTLTTPSSLTTNTWSHVAATYDSTTGQMKIYVNGAQVAIQTVTAYAMTQPVGVVNIGGSGHATNIDDLRVYNRVLSATEIADSYNNQGIVTPFIPNTVLLAPKQDVLSVGMDVDYSADVDVKIGGQSAKIISKPSTGSIQVQAPPHAAGPVNVVVTNPDGTTSTLTNGYTYGADVKPAPAGNSPNPIGGNTTGGNKVNLTTSNIYKLGQYRRQITLTNSSNNVPQNDYQVKVTVDTAAAIATGHMKADGSDIRIIDSDKSTPLNYWIEPGTLNTASTAIWVRGPFISWTQSKTIWLTYGNTANLAASDPNTTFVRTISNAQGIWSMDEASGTNVADTSGNGLNGTATVAGSVGAGVFGNARILNGYVNIPSSTALKPANPPYSMELWAKPTAYNANSTTVFSTDTGIILLNYNQLGCYSLQFCFYSAATSGSRYTPSNILTQLNTWYHLVFVYDGSTAKTYINGVLMANKALSGSLGTPTTNRVCLGLNTYNTSICSGSYPYAGGVDEARIYDKALSAAEVSDIYNNYGFAVAAQPRTLLVGKRPATTPLTTSVAGEENYGPTVTFGGTPATNVTVTDTGLSATAPAHAAGPVDVVVTNPDGQKFTLASSYLYAGPPVINTVAPNRVSQAGGDTITISGSNFRSPPEVKIGGIVASNVTMVDGNTLQVVAPPHAPGPVDVTVTDPDGQTITAARSLTYLGNPPSLTSVSPNNGPTTGGTVVTLNGANFTTQGTYRLPMTVTNSGAALTNYQLQLSLDTASLITAGKMRYDGGDMRVDMDGVVPLSFWVDPSTINTTDTKVWVKMPSLPTGDTVVNITYGNPLATTASNASAVFSKVIPNAKAYFTFDEASVGSSADSFGTVALPANFGSVTSVPGKFGNGRGFNGATAMIYNTTAGIRPTAAVSLETWVNFASIKAQDIIGSYVGTSGGNQSLLMNASGQLYFTAYINGATKTVTTTDVPSLNTWHHVVGTYDSATGVQSIYVDGVLGATQTTSGPITINTAVYWCMGGTPYNNCNGTQLNGKLDEVRIYDRALTAAEISDLANNYAGVFPGAPNTMAVMQPRATGLSIATGTEVQRELTVTFGGTLATLLDKPSSSSIRVIAPPHAAGAVDVQVTNTDNQTATLANGFTYTSGIAVNTITPNRGGAAGGTNVTIGGSGFFVGAPYRTPLTVSNTSSGNITDYQVPVTINTASLISAGKMRSDGADIRILDSDGVTSLSYWIEPGTINTANTKIWLRIPYMLASSSRTISLAYGNPSATALSNQAATFQGVVSGVQGEWHLDETSGTIAADTSGNNYQGSITSSAFGLGRFGNAQVFPGTGTAYVSITGNANLRPTAAVSAEAWFRATDPSLPQTIVSGLNNPNQGYGITLSYATGDATCNTALCFAIGTGSAVKGVGIPASNVQANTWYHVVGTYDGTALKLYLNGTEVASTPQTGAIVHNPTISYPLCIGGKPSGSVCTSGATFKGPIDEVRIYNRAVSASEVASLFGGYGLASTAQPRTVLVGAPRVSGLSVTPGVSEAFGGSVTFGGNPATGVQGTATSINATTPAHPLGFVDVTVTNPGGASATLTNGYKYSVYGYKFLNSPLTLLQNEAGTLTVQPVDEFGNAVTTPEDVTLTFNTSSSGGFFARDLNEDPSTRWSYNTVTLPAGSSQAIMYYKDNVKGTPTITANGPAADGSIATSQQERITSQFRLKVTGISTPIQSGIPSSVTVQAVDANDQPVPSYTGTVHFTSTDTVAALPSDFKFTTDLLGTKTFVNGVTMVTQGNWCVTATDTSDSDIIGSQCNINVTAPNNGTPAKLKFITAPQTLQPTVSSTVMTVQSQDSGGSPAPVAANTSVYLYSDSPTGQFSTDGVNWFGSGQSVTIKAGTTSVNFYHRDSAFGPHQLTGRDDQGTGADFGLTNATQNVNITAGPAFKLAVLPPAGTLTAGTASGAFQVVLQDQFGNPTTATSDQPVWLTSSNASARFSADGNFSGNLTELPLTIGVGDTSTTFYYVDTKAGDRMIAASDSSPPNGATGLVDASRSVNVQAGSVTGVSFTSLVQQVVAGTASDTMTVQLIDQYGNATNAATDTALYLSGTQPGAQFFAIDGITSLSQITVPGGQSTASFKFKQNTFTPLQTIVVSDGSPADGATGLADASQQQTITPGTAAKLAITTPEPSATAAGTKHLIRVELQNQGGIAIPSNGVTTLYLRTTSSGTFSAIDNPWTPVTTLTIPNGEDHVDLYYQDTAAGTATITIADEASGGDVALTNASQTIPTVAGSAGKLRITTAPKTLFAGQASGAITVQLEDPYGNPVTADSNTTVTLGSSSANGYFATNSGGPFNGTVTTAVIPSGQSTVNIFYKDLKAGTPLITISRSGLTDATQTETINWGAPSLLQISSVPSVVAGQTSAPLTITVLNSYNTPIEVATPLMVSLTVNSATGRFDTAAAGAFDGTVTSITIPVGQSSGQVYVKDTKAGTRTVTGSAGSATGNRSVQVVADSPAKLFITSAAQDLEIGERSNAITVQLRDQFDNIATAPSPVTVTFSSTSPTGRFVNSSKVDIPNVVIGAGSSSATFYYTDTTIGSPSLTLNVTGLTSVTQTQQISYGTPEKFSLGSSKTTLLSGEVAPMTVYVLNSSNQPIPAPSDIVAKLSSSSVEGAFDLSSGGNFDGSITTVTIPAGSTSTDFYYRDTASGASTVLASQTGYGNGSYAFNVTASGLYQVAFTSPARTTVAGATSQNLTLRLQDQYGNVQSAPSARTITVHNAEATTKMSALSTGTFASGDLQLNMAAGQQSINFYYQDTVAGTKTLTASSAGLLDSTQDTSVTPAGFHHVGFTSAQQTIAAKTPSGPITLTGYDQYNNARSIAPASPPLLLDLSSGSPGGQFSTAASPWQPTTQLSIPNNTTTYTFYYQDDVLGSTVMTLTSPSAVVPSVTQPITTVPGPVAALKFTSDPQTVVKSTPSGPISVTLADQFGYTATSDQPIQVRLTSESASGEFSLNGVNGWASTLDLTYSAGQSTTTFFYRDSSTGGFSLQAASDGLVSTSQVIAIVPGEIAKIAADIASPVTAGQPTPVTLQTNTADDLPAAVVQDTVVDLASNNGSEFSLSDTNWQPVSNVTIPAGQHQVQLFYRNTAAGNDTVHVTPPSDSGWLGADVSVSVTAAGYTMLGFQTLPKTVAAGSASSAIVVTARDQFGNVVLPSSDQTLYMYGPGTGEFATDPAGPWTANSVVMPAGTGAATFYYQDTLPGVGKTLIISDQTPLDSPDAGIVNAVGQISVTSLPPSKVALVYSGGNVIAGEVSGPITIQAKQSDNSPAVLANDLVIDLASSSSSGRYFATTDSNSPVITQISIPAGQSEVTVYFSSNKSGSINVTASSSGLQDGTGTVPFIGAAPAQLGFVTPPQVKPAGQDSDQIRLQLQDQFGNPAVSGSTAHINLQTTSVTGEFSATAGAGWAPIPSLDLAAGSSDLYFYYKDVVVGQSTLTASTDDLSVTNAEQTFNTQAGSAARLTFTSLAPSLTAGQTSDALNITLTDAYGNITVSPTDVTLYFGSSSSGGSFSGTSDFAGTVTTATILAGQSTTSVYYKDILPGSPTLTASDLPLPDSPDVGLTNTTLAATIAAGDETSLEVKGASTSAAGTTVPLTITLLNQYGAPIVAAGDQTVYLKGNGEFSLTDFGATVQSVVISAGQASTTVYYRDTVAGPRTLTAADETGTDDTGLANGQLDLMILPASLMRLKFIAPAPNLEAGETSDALTIQTQDAFGNVVSVPNDFTVNLSTTSNGQFSLDSGFAATTAQVTIVAGGNAVTVYYRDNTPGSPTLIASDLPAPDSPDQGLVNATLNATINAGTLTQLAWSGWPATVESGQVVGPLTISVQNRFGVDLPVGSDLTLQLGHTAPESGFSLGSNGPWNLTSVTIPSGSSKVQVYYHVTAPVNDTVTAADNPLGGPDIGLSDIVKSIQVQASTPAQLAITNTPYTTVANHLSPQYTVEIRNSSGGSTPVGTDMRLYLRSTSGGGEFATDSGGPWGLNYVTVPAGQSSVSFYYRDSNTGSPTLTIADNLPITPDSGLTNVSQAQAITPQTVHHLLVTNIATPQTQGSPSSVVVIARDSENYVVSGYSGTIHFTSDDPGAVLPADYTFNPAIDKGAHTFINGVSFPTSGVKTVTATDADGITGQQTDIIVNNVPAGPIVDLRFAGVPSPFQLDKGIVSPPLVLETFDAAGRLSNAPSGGFPVRLTSTSPSGQFATDPSGPWSNELVTSVPAGLNSLAIYYKDTTPGTPVITASDWAGDSDDPGLQNAQLNAEIVQTNHFRIDAPSSVTAGQPFNVTISNLDEDDNVITNYNGDKGVTFSGPTSAPNGQGPLYPTNVTFTNGVAVVPVTLYNAETATLIGTEGDVMGVSGDITVNPALAATFTLTAPGVVTAGQSFNVDIEAKDAFGNRATGFTGQQALDWSGANNAPDNSAPTYPSNATFNQGMATVQLTLYKREIVTLQAEQAALSGTSGLISVNAAAAKTLSMVSGDHQHGPVSQMLPQPLVVKVTDDFENPVDSYQVDFSVITGGGRLLQDTATTALDGTAQTQWVLGPASGQDNNTMEAKASTLSGSPLTFTASADAKGFAVTTPNPVTAGQPFTIQIKVVDEQGTIDTSYNGKKTLHFSGPASGPNGQAPQYPIEVEFVDGVAQPDPSITLFAAETTDLTIIEGDLSGTTLPFAVRSGPVAKLAITSPPGQTQVNTPSSPITICVQDAFGNAAVANQKGDLQLQSTSETGEFASNADGPWGGTISVNIGESCINVFYRDKTAGTFTLTFGSEGVSETTQAINVIAEPEPEPEPQPQPQPGQTPGPGSETPVIPGAGPSSATANAITVYADAPTTPTSIPTDSPSLTLALPVVVFPVIHSPTPNAIVTPINQDIVVSGVGPPSQTLSVKADNGAILASTTTDQNGSWIIHIAKSKFSGNKQTIYAEMTQGGARSPTVTFVIKQPTIAERIIEWWSR